MMKMLLCRWKPMSNEGEGREAYGPPVKKKKVTNRSIEDYFASNRPLLLNNGNETSTVPIESSSRSFNGDAETQGSQPSSTSSREHTNAASCLEQANEAICTDIAQIFQDSRRNGHLVNKLTDNEKLRLLENHLMPPDDFQYPYTPKGGKRPQKIYLGRQHISGSTYSSSKFSPGLKGVLCIPCMLFATDQSVND